MGDALAVCLMEMRFKPEDFAVYHPGGALGKIIVARKDILEHTLKPMVSPDASIKRLFSKYLKNVWVLQQWSMQKE
jgi:arabinose-5-phosphate isomerase